MAGFDNFPIVLRQIELFRRNLRAGSEAGAVAEMQQVLAKALTYTPIETGALRNSGRVIGPVRRGETSLVSVTFGGPSHPRYVHYAVYVHENAYARHAPPTQWKFLERAFNERKRGMAARIARRAAAASRRAVR